MRYCQGQSLHQISSPYVKRFSCETPDRQTHRQTDALMGPILSTADMPNTKGNTGSGFFFSHPTGGVLTDRLILYSQSLTWEGKYVLFDENSKVMLQTIHKQSILILTVLKDFKDTVLVKEKPQHAD